MSQLSKHFSTNKKNIYKIRFMLFLIMRIECVTIWAAILINLTMGAAVYGGKSGKRHRKRMVPNFYADFAPITGLAEDFSFGDEDSVLKRSGTGCAPKKCDNLDSYDHPPRPISKSNKCSKGQSNSDANSCRGGGGSGSGDACRGGGVSKSSSVGNLLTSDPKQKASNIAVQAAQDAKAANDMQMPAGKAAAQHVKAEFAEKAMQAAKAAEAALAGKQQIVEQLEYELREAQAVAQEEYETVQADEAIMDAAVQASKNAEEEVKVITSLLASAQENLCLTEQVAKGVQHDIGGKTQVLGAAKNRVEVLIKQLDSARCDFEKTKKAAYAAACAAVDAREKVNKARRRKAHRRRRI